jgi:hypothetical protein
LRTTELSNHVLSDRSEKIWEALAAVTVEGDRRPVQVIKDEHPHGLLEKDLPRSTGDKRKGNERALDACMGFFGIPKAIVYADCSPLWMTEIQSFRSTWRRHVTA